MASIDRPWIQLYEGQRFDFLKPQPAMISIETIAHSLSNLCRYNGHTKKFYSVAQHCCYAYDMASDKNKRVALGHDFGESATSDIASPLKNYPPIHEAYMPIETVIETMLAKKFEHEYPYPPEVKYIDRSLLKTECRDIMPSVPQKIRQMDGEFYKFRIKPWSIQRSRYEFLRRYYEVTGNTKKANKYRFLVWINLPLEFIRVRG